MKLTYYGHSCFVIEGKGYKIALDPYFGVPGYKELHIEAHEICCSHEHEDHHYTEAVTLLPKAESPFEITSLASFHDEVQGRKRGLNTIRIFSARGLRIAHFGDLGCELAEAQQAALQGLDAVMIPVGGFYTIDALQAKKVIEEIHPKMVIPMHYRLGSLGYSEIGELRLFTELFSHVRFSDGNELEITGEGREQVVVPKYLC